MSDQAPGGLPPDGDHRLVPARLTGRVDIRSLALTALAVLAILYTLYFARVVLIPITVAVLINLLLSPIVSWLSRRGIPTSLSAGAILLGLLLLIGGTGYVLSEPAKEWLDDAPRNLRELGREFREMKGPLEDIKELGEEVDEMTEIESRKGPTQKVEISTPSMLDRTMQGVPTFVASSVVVFFTSFFLLASGNRLGRRLLTFGKSWPQKRQIILVSREIQAEVARYLRTVSLINIVLGAAVATAMWLLDVPNPILWGVMVTVLNFAPYVGAIVSAAVLTLVGVATFDSLGQALLVPAVFIVLTSLEGGLITPMVLGQRLSLSALVVFVSVVFWGWLWGPMGALIAVPLMSSIKVFFDHIEATAPLSAMMEGARRPS